MDRLCACVRRRYRPHVYLTWCPCRSLPLCDNNDRWLQGPNSGGGSLATPLARRPSPPPPKPTDPPVFRTGTGSLPKRLEEHVSKQIHSASELVLRGLGSIPYRVTGDITEARTVACPGSDSWSGGGASGCVPVTGHRATGIVSAVT